MAECELLPGCAFFNDKMPIEQGLGAMYKKYYCIGDHSTCARYMVFKKLGALGAGGSLHPGGPVVADPEQPPRRGGRQPPGGSSRVNYASKRSSRLHEG